MYYSGLSHGDEVLGDIPSSGKHSGLQQSTIQRVALPARVAEGYQSDWKPITCFGLESINNSAYLNRMFPKVLMLTWGQIMSSVYIMMPSKDFSYWQH